LRLDRKAHPALERGAAGRARSLAHRTGTENAETRGLARRFAIFQAACDRLPKASFIGTLHN